MTRLRLFTVFHGNLDFSSIPERDLSLVIARCYWPLLRLADESGIPIGLEMPARTLRRLADEDPEWLKCLLELAARGAVELVGSGLAQVVAPLAPVDVNRANLAAGREAYARLTGAVPSTWFVHEQTFAPGVAELVREIGAEALVMEWNNPASGRPDLRALRYRPARIAAGAYEPIPVLWNDCVWFQKLQRAVHGEAPPGEYLGLLEHAATSDDERFACAYGGDLEIFDYRPGHATPPGAAEGLEWDRLATLLRTISRDPRFELRLPRDVRRDLEPGPVVELASAVQPIPCKKQPRYNPTRWAVSGRDGLGLNTRCFALRRLLRAGDALERRAAGGSLADSEELVSLWASDFRTRATEERLEDFHTRTGAALERARRRLERLAPPLVEGADVIVTNPWSEPWQGHPIEIPLALPPGRLAGARLACAPHGAVAPDGWQLEVEGRYGDGSVRRATLVIEPQLAPGASVSLRLVATQSRDAEAPGVDPDGATLATGAVEARFLPHRGGALACASFASVDPRALVGTVPHGSFDEIAFTPDFYSGHVVAVGEDGTKTTDLSPARVVPGASGPLRVGVAFDVATRLGEWTKLWRVWRRRPRLDLVHVLRFHETRLRSLRVGACTWLPAAFERGRLAHASVNGGPRIERHVIPPGARIEQARAVSTTVTASACLGATEGWISAGDDAHGVALLGDRSEAAVVPLLEFADVDERFLLRVHHSAAETDETSASFFRGARRFAFAWLGHGGDLAPVREAASALERGLVYRTEVNTGVARGL